MVQKVSHSATPPKNMPRSWLKQAVRSKATNAPTNVPTKRYTALDNTCPRKGWAKIITVTADAPGEESWSQKAVASASTTESHVRRQNKNQPGGNTPCGKRTPTPFQKPTVAAAGCLIVILSPPVPPVCCLAVQQKCRIHKRVRIY